MIKTSTGLAAHYAVSGSTKSAFDGGLIKVYDATEEPATADAAVTGTLIWTISVNGAGTGLTFEPAAVGRAAVKKASETWCGATVAGAARYYRFVAPGDDGLASTTQKRIQGSCGNTAEADLYLSNPTLVTNASPTAKALSSYSVVLPTN